jgi:ubiquinone/menaquinone biosynthesis C-methylase UbiE
MDQLRKLHNDCKRRLITQYVWPGAHVLDCGCGRGGDWHKWRAVRAHVAAIDPDIESLKEAEDRALSMGFGVWFLGVGDVRNAVRAGPFDVVCYNFSLQYIFESDELFKESVQAISDAVRRGGFLIGIAPDKMRVEAFTPLCDALGNSMYVEAGRLVTHLAGGPFYASGAKSEPLLDSGRLIDALEAQGFKKIVWEPMLDVPNSLISDVYSKFVFKKM